MSEPQGMDETWPAPRQVVCAACGDALVAGTERVAALAAQPPEARDSLCPRHVRWLRAQVSDPDRGGVVASLLEAARAGVVRRRSATSCAICSRETHAERLAAPTPLCLHHMRRLASQLGWDDLLADCSRLAEVIERRHDLPAVLWGSDRLVDLHEGDDACPVCAARTAARLRQFEWLADAVHRFPSQAAGSAVALCAPHGWRFHAWSPGSGQVVLDLAAEAWAERLRWLAAGLEHRPPGQLGARVAALPAILSSLADDAGRLHIAVIARATVAALLRTPGTVLAHLTAPAFGTEPCAAEHHAPREVAASSEAAVCASDLRIVRSARPRRR